MSLGELRRLYAHYSKRGVRFVGNYSSWTEALSSAKGYTDQEVLQKAIAANRLVMEGKAVYERDGVAFYDRAYPFPLLANLLYVAKLKDGLSVLDFGGGLASTYFQCLPYLSCIDNLRWNVVEQPHFVEWGRQSVANERLSFFENIEGAKADIPANAALVSGVLQYLPDPFDVGRRLVSVDTVRWVIIDRTPLLADEGKQTQLVVQEVPSSLVASSYPAWLFSRQDLLSPFLQGGFEVIAEWDALDAPMGGWGRKVVFKGFALERK